MKLKTLLLLPMLLPAASFCQLVQVHHEERSKACGASLYSSVDVEDEHFQDNGRFYSRYYSFMDGCKVKVIDLKTFETDFTYDVDAESGKTINVQVFRNLTASDGKWSVIYSAGNEVHFVNGGKKEKLSDKASGIPLIGVVDGKIFVILNETDGISFLVARNDLPKTASILKGSKYVSALRNIGLKDGAKFDALGERGSDARRIMFSK